MKLVAKWFSTCVLALTLAFGVTDARAERAARGGGLRSWFFGAKSGAQKPTPKGGHDKGSRPSTEEKHQRGDERRIRDQGGEKKDGKKDDGRNAWKKRRGG